eukprot:sb/3470641/
MGSHKEYMELKKQKLSDQNTDHRHLLHGGATSNILRGVSIYITGFTEPPATILKEIVLRNGGAVHMFFSKSNVSHIIASHLPDFKIKMWKNDLIVKPEWIVECDKQKQRLSEANFILYRSSLNIKTMVTNKSTAVASSSKTMAETTDTKFVSEFYSNSRLHHLSTSVSELRHFVHQLQSEFIPGQIQKIENKKIRLSFILT